jgi:hypothetical protein
LGVAGVGADAILGDGGRQANQPAAAAVATQATDWHRGINTGQASDIDRMAVQVVFSVLTWIWVITKHLDHKYRTWSSVEDHISDGKHMCTE